METIVIVRTSRGIRQGIENAFRFLDVSLKPNLPIIIKPNLCCIKGPETGATTDPRIVEAVINYMKLHYHSKHFYVVESDATLLNADMAFQLLGYNRLARHTKVQVVNLSKIPSKQIKFANNLNLPKVRVPKILQRPHFLVSIAKMKTHGMCHLTATLKNVFGCNPEPYKAKYHERLNKNIVDLAQAFKPHLSIIEAISAMEGNGPIDGVPIMLNALIFGSDPLAVDHLTARAMGINPRKVEYLRLAERQGLGTTKYDILGVSLRDIKRKFRRIPLSIEIYSRIEPLLNIVRHTRVR